MKLLINTLLLATGVFVMVVPNSFQLITASLLIAVNGLIVLQERRNIINPYLLYCWLILSCIFIPYILISPIQFSFKGEMFLKYILFPLLWLNIFSYIRLNFSIERFSRILINLSVLSLLSVIVLYSLLLNGYDYASYLIVAPNINSDYNLGFTLHVYGNLIFLAIGLFIVPHVYKSGMMALLYILLSIVVALISGRTALMVSICIGILILVLRYTHKGKAAMVLALFVFVCAIFFSIRYFFPNVMDYNLIEYFKGLVIYKLQDLGGEARAGQTTLAIQQIMDHPWGIGFKSIGIERNSERSFQYEVLILVTIVRFGIFVFGIIVLSLYPIFRNLLLFRHINVYHKFYLAGFLTIVIFSITNPYLESFSFQWMYFAPLVFLSEFIQVNPIESNEKQVADLPVA